MSAIRSYAFPTLLTLGLHGALILVLFQTWQSTAPRERLVQPEIVRSELIVLTPKARPKAKPKPAPARAAAAPAKAEPEPKPEAPPAPEPPAPDLAQLERDRLEKEKREAERAARLEALSNQAFETALEEELEALAADEDEEQAASFRAGIYERIVTNWSRPPSARNGMKARVLVDLIPTGEVVGVTIVESSGNGAFDQSVEAAVRKARRFQVPEENAIFERYFRRFSVLFQPEDLLR